jgi:hypothetical protein
VGVFSHPEKEKESQNDEVCGDDRVLLLGSTHVVSNPPNHGTGNGLLRERWWIVGFT